MGRLFAICIVVFLAISPFGVASAQREPAAFAKQELARHWRVRERMELERVKKAEVDQGNYDALHYDLKLDIDPQNGSIAGTLSLWAMATEANPGTLVLDLTDELAVSAVREGGQSAGFIHQNDLLTISLSSSYARGDTIHLEIDYAGTPTSINDEIGQNAFTFDTHGPRGSPRDQIVVYTISEPCFARAWWPCKDVPDDKATIRLRVTVPDTLIVASNGRLEENTSLPDRRRTYVWYEKYPIATYLVSLAVSNYEVFSDYFHYPPGDSMRVDYFVYPEHLDTAKVAFDVTVPMIEFYSGLFGRYPFISEKYGMAEIGWQLGAMEHQTCTSLGSFFLRQSRGYDWVIAHELSHQWWGDLVTPGEWADVWLNEGFATYSEALWVEHLQGAQAYRDSMATRQLPGGFQGTLYDPDRLFGVTVYWKGSWVLHMLRRVMGDGQFFDALRAYASVEEFGYKNATTPGFQGVCEEYHGGSLSWFFDEWVYGEGQPRYAYYWSQSRSGGENTIDLTLRQLQPDPVFVMPIDIRFSLGDGATTIDTTITLWNSERVEGYRLAFERPVTAVDVDPELWVLKTVEERVLNPLTLEILPNPFNATTRVGFEMGLGGHVEVDIYDVTGARVRCLYRDDLPAGYHELGWNGKGEQGGGVSSGVYFVRIETGQGTLVKKAVLLK